MSESPQQPGPPAGEGAFGAPPGAPYPPAYPPPAYPPPAYPPPAYPPPAYPPQGLSGAQPASAGYVPPPAPPFPVSAVVLLVVSVISLVATGIIGIPSAVVAVLAWRRNAADPAGARQRTTTGWIVYAVNFAVGVPLLIWFYVWALGSQ